MNLSILLFWWLCVEVSLVFFAVAPADVGWLVSNVCLMLRIEHIVPFQDLYHCPGTSKDHFGLDCLAGWGIKQGVVEPQVSLFVLFA
jgi:hypothetical protein